ncbi:unnamed protein product [Brassica rapa]|uniref:Uncharacterized protein n=1 Tax=Brassica campestris TaxID=3711 RepID=A0A3P5Y317_BRACM|nr:unnamed protein product [Brassica rapa]VDC61862.1 unnamed protein product [Brassica rapa]
MVAFLSGYPRKEVDRLRRSYIKEVNKSEGFDVSGLPVPDSAPGLTEHICNDTCSPLILLYAKLGLHRYNLVQGKNLQLSSVKKYNKSMASVNSSYYITLVAIDPATQLLQTFQTRVNELRYGELVLECCTARPLGETHICGIKKISDYNKPVEDLLHTFPEWPPKNPFKKSKRCYVLKKSELRENDDWIRLYLELAVAASNRDTLENHLVSNLKIVKVAIDTTSTQEGLDLFAIVYIRYKDSCEARVGKDVDRVAVVRRFFNEGMGSFSLVGQNLGIIQKKSNKQLLHFKPWLLYTPRWRLKAYRHSGLTLSRRVPKTRSIEFFLSQFTFRDDFTKKGKESECKTELTTLIHV